jgi:Coenzyme PQQ synthesis protein D (PqqD)
MPESPTFRVNSPMVSHENIEGETMVIHFDTGTYYNLQASALTVWEQLVNGASLDDIVAAVTRGYRGDPTEIRRSVSGFLDELVRENLVVHSSDPRLASAPGAVPASSADPAPFTPPLLNKYTDMQDFLLADPVHDTDEAGFPKPKTARADHA